MDLQADATKYNISVFLTIFSRGHLQAAAAVLAITPSRVA